MKINYIINTDMTICVYDYLSFTQSILIRFYCFTVVVARYFVFWLFYPVP